MDKYRSFQELLSPGWEYRLYSDALWRLEEGYGLPFMYQFGEVEEQYKVEGDDQPDFRLASKDELSVAIQGMFEHFQTRPKNEQKVISFLQTHLCYFEGEVWDCEADWDLRPPRFEPPLNGLATQDHEWIEENELIFRRTPLTKLALKLTVNHIVATYNSSPSISQIIREVERASTIIQISDLHYFQVKWARLKEDAATNGS